MNKTSFALNLSTMFQGLLLVAILIFAPSSLQAQAPVYQATNGYLAVEAESATNLPTGWVRENTFADASGESYLRTTLNSFGRPGRGILNYNFAVDSGGAFQFALRSQIGEGDSGTDSNDTWVRLLDANGNALAPRSNQNDPRGNQWFKSYQNNFGRWSYQASNVDRVGRSISWQLADDTEYTLQLSARSRGYLVDRIFLWDQGLYNFANEERGFATGNSQRAFDRLQNSALVSAVPEPSSVALLLSLGLLGACQRRRDSSN